MARWCGLLWAVLFHALAGAATPAVVARGDHAVVLKSDGSLAAWGRDSDGQLGTGRTLFSATPRTVQDLPPIQAVSAYSEHVLALDKQGRVWAWGSNKFGHLGRRVQRNAALPGRVQGISDVVGLAATNTYSAALKSDGTVWVWGGSSYGDLASFSNVIDPIRIDGLTDVVQIAGGLQHVLARKRDGSVFAFGLNAGGALGNGSFTSSMKPTQVLGLPRAIDISACASGSMALTSDGKVWVWGLFSGDPLRSGNPLAREYTGFPGRVVQVIAAGQAYAVVDNGTLWAFDDDNPLHQVVGLSSLARADVSKIGNVTIGITTAKTLVVLSGNRFGQAGNGSTVPLGDTPAVAAVTNVTQAAVGTDFVVAVAADGKVSIWGRDIEGALGVGSVIIYAAPIGIAGLPPLVKVAASTAGNVALDANGNVWAWGTDDTLASFQPHSRPLQIPISDVIDIAMGWGNFLFLKKDGSVWISGFYSIAQPTPVQGLPPISKIAGGWNTAYFIDGSGRLYAIGDNSSGQLGDGTFVSRQTSPSRISGILEPVVQVAADFRIALAVTVSGAVYVWGDLRSYGDGYSGPTSVPTPLLEPALSNVAEVAAGAQANFLARLADGRVVSWGTNIPTRGRDGPGYPPAPVADLDSVISIAANTQGSYAIRSDGTVWGWGPNALSNSFVGDGTFSPRARPVLVLRENGAGHLDTNDWFLDARPGTAKAIPPGKIPKVLPVMNALSAGGVLNVDARVNVAQADQAKTLELYVLGLVPPAFFSQVPTGPGAQARIAELKADQLVLVNLTPSGWNVAAGQLQSFISGIGSSFQQALNVLSNINPATIPGARFCIGYGESAADMLRTSTIGDVLALEGASSSALGLPCLLSGVYLTGPPTSVLGSPITVRAVVVGQGPTGQVRVLDGFTPVSSDLALVTRNPAVSEVSVTFTPSTARGYSFRASYPGDSLNAPGDLVNEIPLRHEVRAPLATTTTRIDAPVSSEIGMEVKLIAYVSGNSPGGTVQFRRNGTPQGTPALVSNDRATVSVVGLGLGDYSFTADYSGDAANAASTAPAVSHRVLDVATSVAVLASSANPSAFGDAITVRASVAGSSPTGTVTLRDGPQALATATLASGVGTFLLRGLVPGTHVLFADYSGDAANPKATSNAVFEQINLNLSPGGDADGDGIPNAIELAEGRDPLTKDNDVFGSSRLFAMQQYRDIFSREGDSTGIAFWTSQIDGGAQGRAQMIDNLFSSGEFQGTASPVARLYFAYFLRIPDYAGLQFWISQSQSGTPLIQISRAFAGSAEFASRYGALTDAQFVALVYRNVLGRTPDSGGLAFWTSQLASGAIDRGGLMVGFSESEEYRADISSQIYVTMAYASMLRRSPDASGLSFWASYLDSGNSGLALINAVLGAPEYRARFLP